MNDNLFLCFIVGFIDGDGCIATQTNRRDCAITIKKHSNWLESLNYIIKRASLISKARCSEAKLNKTGYALAVLSNSITVRLLKTTALRNELPVLTRKWDKVDENFVSREETGILRRKLILEMIEEGKTNSEICSILNLRPSTVSTTARRAGKPFKNRVRTWKERKRSKINDLSERRPSLWSL